MRPRLGYRIRSAALANKAVWRYLGVAVATVAGVSLLASCTASDGPTAVLPSEPSAEGASAAGPGPPQSDSVAGGADDDVNAAGAQRVDSTATDRRSGASEDPQSDLGDPLVAPAAVSTVQADDLGSSNDRGPARSTIGDTELEDLLLASAPPETTTLGAAADGASSLPGSDSPRVDLVDRLAEPAVADVEWHVPCGTAAPEGASRACLPPVVGEVEQVVFCHRNLEASPDVIAHLDSGIRPVHLTRPMDVVVGGRIAYINSCATGGVARYLLVTGVSSEAVRPASLTDDVDEVTACHESHRTRRPGAPGEAIDVSARVEAVFFAWPLPDGRYRLETRPVNMIAPC